jgi:hypothetical protein
MLQTMGIIDDYYGGYESLAMFMDEDGVIDYEAAYGANGKRVGAGQVSCIFGSSCL